MRLSVRRSRHSPHSFGPRAVLVGASLLWIVAFTGCNGPTEFKGIYEETGVVGSNRSHALRLTLFEFSDEVGGTVEFYRIAADANPADNPFFQPEACRWFGPGPRRNNEFLISLEGLEDIPLIARVTQDENANRLIATLTTSGGLELREDDGPIPLPAVIVFERLRGVEPEPSCLGTRTTVSTQGSP